MIKERNPLMLNDKAYQLAVGPIAQFFINWVVVAGITYGIGLLLGSVFRLGGL
jgi:hypothetical protein